MKYYAFKPYGRFAISGPYKTRLEAKPHGKPGHKCRFCGEYAGGMTVCRRCLCEMLFGEPFPTPEKKPVVKPITSLFCTA